MKSKIIIFDKRPVGIPEPDCFRQEVYTVPEPGTNEILLKTLYVSVDPYLRGRMREGKSYVSGFNPGEPIKSGIIAQVVKSHNPGFKKGDFVNGMLYWAEYQVSDGVGLLKVNSETAPLSAYLGVLGMTGLTAYLGLMEIGRPQPGETLVVSGAAGAVGMVAGQIGKIMGCRVAGITGSDEKVEMLKSDLGFDEAINYKTTSRMRLAIANSCPSGVDIYFDNVGGSISDSVLLNLNKFSRIVVCGTISQYNNTSVPTGPRLQSVILTNSALMKGFLVNDYYDRFPVATGQLVHWFLEGKLKNKETVAEGFENIPKAFIGLFHGINTGKMVVKV